MCPRHLSIATALHVPIASPLTPVSLFSALVSLAKLNAIGFGAGAGGRGSTCQRIAWDFCVQTPRVQRQNLLSPEAQRHNPSSFFFLLSFF